MFLVPDSIPVIGKYELRRITPFSSASSGSVHIVRPGFYTNPNAYLYVRSIFAALTRANRFFEKGASQWSSAPHVRENIQPFCRALRMFFQKIQWHFANLDQCCFHVDAGLRIDRTVLISRYHLHRSPCLIVNTHITKPVMLILVFLELRQR